jgi:type II secretory ATPase GspE/PulE/Tfp pilus assembly ATPase PilB-like protein
MIVEETSDLEVKAKAVEEGLKTLRDMAVDRLLEGVTTVEEVLSITSG